MKGVPKVCKISTLEVDMGMQSFILCHLLNENIDVYCGGEDVFFGQVVGCADNVLTLETNGHLTYIAVDKIISLWKRSTAESTPEKSDRKGKSKRKS